MNDELIDRALDTYRKPVWAAASFITGSLGTVALCYIMYQLFPVLFIGRTIEAGESLEMDSRFELPLLESDGMMYFLQSLYLVSLWCLIVAYIKEQSSIARILSSIGHIVVLLLILLRFLG